MATRYTIAEQVKLKLSGGYPAISNSIRIEDIRFAINQRLNISYKSEQFNVTFPSGETIPNNLTIFTYEGVKLSTVNKKSECVLPVMPVSLPRNMGVYQIIPEYKDNDRCKQLEFIPLALGQYNLLQGQPLISDLLGQVGYECFGNRIRFFKDLSNDLDSVTIREIVADLHSVDDYTMLPIPADMEYAVIDDVFKSFLPVQPEERVSDNYQSNQPVKP